MDYTSQIELMNELMNNSNFTYSPLYVVEWGLPNVIGVRTKQKRNLPKAHILPFAGIDQAKVTAEPGSEYTVG